MDITVLENYGVDAKKGLERCMGDLEFYEKLLSLFLNDDSFMRSKRAYEQKDYKEMFQCMHELKGASGNADLKMLYQAICPLVEILRFGNGTEEEINLHFKKVEMAYEKAKEGIFIATC